MANYIKKIIDKVTLSQYSSTTHPPTTHINFTNKLLRGSVLPKDIGKSKSEKYVTLYHKRNDDINKTNGMEY